MADAGDGRTEPAWDERFAALRDETLKAIERPRESDIDAIRRLAIDPGARILDAGCGPGPHLGRLADAAGAEGVVVGLDPDPLSVAVASDVWSDRVANGRVALVEGRLPEMPEPVAAAGPFDLVWSSYVFHHLPRPIASIAALATHVRPGGRIAILDGDAGAGFPMTLWPPNVEVILRSAMARADEERQGADPLSDHYAPFAVRGLPGAMVAAGLEDVSVVALSDTIVPPFSTDDLEIILGWLKNQATRLAEFLSPRDLSAVADLFDPSSSRYMLSNPGFFWLRTSLLITGRTEPG